MAKEYKNRLRSRPVLKEFRATKIRRRKIFQIKLKLATQKKSIPWTMKDLDRALCYLKNNKSRDFGGNVNKIFKNNVIGSDLKKSILKMLNSLRAKKLIHQFWPLVSGGTPW